MTLDVGLVAHVQTKLVAKLVPPPVVRVMAVSHGVKVEPVSSIKRRTHTPREMVQQASK